MTRQIVWQDSSTMAFRALGYVLVLMTLVACGSEEVEPDSLCNGETCRSGNFASLVRVLNSAHLMEAALVDSLVAKGSVKQSAAAMAWSRAAKNATMVRITTTMARVLDAVK